MYLLFYLVCGFVFILINIDITIKILTIGFAAALIAAVDYLEKKRA